LEGTRPPAVHRGRGAASYGGLHVAIRMCGGCKCGRFACVAVCMWRRTFGAWSSGTLLLFYYCSYSTPPTWNGCVPIATRSHRMSSGAMYLSQPNAISFESSRQTQSRQQQWCSGRLKGLVAANMPHASGLPAVCGGAPEPNVTQRLPLPTPAGSRFRTNARLFNRMFTVNADSRPA
jgi:hypothetical protein